jgi:hypothetical protein
MRSMLSTDHSPEVIARRSNIAHRARLMSDQDEPKTNERDSDEGRNNDSESESAREPAKTASKEVAAKPRSRASAREAAAKAPAGAPSSRVGVFVVLALLAGGAAGWFGHIQQSKAAAAKADSAAVGNEGPCKAWEEAICSKSGAESAPCMQAKGATELLTASTCEVALTAMPATLEKLKAARASCDNLVTKLCGDLPPGSETCKMVKDKTPSFPSQRCDEMLKQYDQVIAELKQLDAMGGPGGPGPGMAPPGMAPPGMAPPGMPPH